jgi:hypothetical protein
MDCLCKALSLLHYISHVQETSCTQSLTDCLCEGLSRFLTIHWSLAGDQLYTAHKFYGLEAFVAGVWAYERTSACVCVCVCVYVCVCVWAYEHTSACACVCMHICVHACLSMDSKAFDAGVWACYSCMHACAQAHLRARVCVCVHVCSCMCVYVCECLCMCVCACRPDMSACAGLCHDCKLSSTQWISTFVTHNGEEGLDAVTSDSVDSTLLCCAGLNFVHRSRRAPHVYSYACSQRSLSS